MTNAMNYADHLTLDQFRTYFNANITVTESLTNLSDGTLQIARKLVDIRKESLTLFPEHDPKLKEATDHYRESVIFVDQRH